MEEAGHHKEQNQGEGHRTVQNQGAGHHKEQNQGEGHHKAQNQDEGHEYGIIMSTSSGVALSEAILILCFVGG